MPFTRVCCLFLRFFWLWIQEKYNPQFLLQSQTMSIKICIHFLLNIHLFWIVFLHPGKKRALSCCFEQVVRKGQAALSHLSGFFHLAWGSVVLTVWRLKHPPSFPAPVVAFPKRVQIWIVFSTPFGADYREPAFHWPPHFMVVSGTS